MSARPLTILSADQGVIEACRQAAAQAGEAIAGVQVLEQLSDLEAAGPLSGLVVVDPRFAAPLSIHEWALSFLREHQVLLFLITTGNVEEAAGLARFVGAQGALPLPLEVNDLAEQLASPFGAPSGQRPQAMAAPDGAALSESISSILTEREPERRDLFLRAVADAKTGLHTAEFWEHRLEEEFKRANRFRFPLGLVSFTWDGEINEAALLDLAGILLLDTRDVDIAAHLGDHSLVAMLPHTGPEGTRLFASRVLEGMRARGLQDLLGEEIELEAQCATVPDTSVPNARSFLAKVLAAQDCRLEA